ncbi:MAG: recombinase RecT [Desulfovibrio sp.]|nr:recombinase RecT [Desulfovibrio sp.]
MSQQYAPAPRGQQAPAVSVENQIMQMKTEFARAIGGATPQEQQRRAERFSRICVTAFRQTPKLQQCSPASVLGAMMTCAQLGLEPNTPSGLAYLIPRWNGKLRTTECQFQVGYRGLIELAYRSGAIASLNADVVYRQEIEAGLFSYTSGIRPSIEHRIDLLDGSARTGNPADIVAAYACAVLKSGEPVIRVVPRRDIDKAMAMSGGKSGPSDVWKTHYAEMAIKTAIHRLAKWLPTTRVDEAMDAEAKYIDAEAKPAEAPQVGMSLETMNAMLQAGQGVADEAPQEAPAVEAPAPQPEPIPESVKQRFPLSAAKSTIPVGEDEAPAPKEERLQAFRPAQEAQTAPKMPEPEAPAQIDVGHSEDAFQDYLADHDYPEGPARQYVGDMVRDGRAPDVATAKAMFVQNDMGVDLQF